MKYLFPKILALCCAVAAGSGAYCLLSGGERVSASAAEEMPRGVMVSSVQTDALGNEVKMDILQTADGEYALADSVRQIYVYDMGNNTSPELKELYTSETGTFDDAEAAMKYLENSEYPIVLKADGLALGKGVLICQTKEEAMDGVREIIAGV